jgi:hypothetical protein
MSDWVQPAEEGCWYQYAFGMIEGARLSYDMASRRRFWNAMDLSELTKFDS